MQPESLVPGTRLRSDFSRVTDKSCRLYLWPDGDRPYPVHAVQTTAARTRADTVLLWPVPLRVGYFHGGFVCAWSPITSTRRRACPRLRSRQRAAINTGSCNLRCLPCRLPRPRQHPRQTRCLSSSSYITLRVPEHRDLNVDHLWRLCHLPHLPISRAPADIRAVSCRTPPSDLVPRTPSTRRRFLLSFAAANRQLADR